MLLQNAWATAFGGVITDPYLVAATKGTANGTSLVINKPGAAVEGDLLVAIMSSDANRTWTGDTSWDERIDQNAVPGLRVATKLAGASEGSSYTFTMSGGGRDMAGQILCIRNAVYDTIGSIVTRTGAGDLVVTGFTSAGGMAILAVAHNSSTLSAAAPSGMSLVDTAALYDSRNSVFIHSVGVGATGSRTSAITGAGTTAGVLIGVKEA